MIVLYVLVAAACISPAPLPVYGQTSLYVSPDGSDSNPGTLALPLASLEAARDAVRELAVSGPVTVYLRQGVYRLEQSFSLTAQDSGSEGAPIRYKAYNGEDVRLIGGHDLDNASFYLVTDPQILERLPQEAQGQVYAIDLLDQGITDFGQLEWAGQLLPAAPPLPELFFNGVALTLARWPNEDYRLTGQVLDGGTNLRQHFHPVPTRDIPTIEAMIGEARGISFRYAYDRAENWQQAEDIWLFGFWYHNWADAHLQVETIDLENRVITTVQPSPYSVRRDQRYYVYNLLEEIDVPGEWYLDRSQGVLYLYPPEPICGAVVQFSLLSEPLITMTDVHWVQVEGLTLEVSRGHGIRIHGGSNTVIAGCTLRNLAQRGIHVSGGNNHTIVSNDIYDVGTGGVILAGGDRQNLTAANHQVINNYFRNFSRLQRTYAPAISLQGVGQRAANNLMHDAPHMAISFGGNDHSIEYNEIFDVAQETDDVGAIYTGRDWTSRGHVIRHNFIHNILGIAGGHGAMGVYLDDLFSSAHVIGNVFYNIPGRALLIGGGRDNVFANNLLIDCDRPVWIDARGLTWAADRVVPGGDWPLHQRLEAVPYTEEPWSSRYPELVGILADEPAVPKNNRITNNILYQSGAMEIAPQALTYGVVHGNLETTIPIEFAGPLDFALVEDSWVFQEMPDFDPIPFASIGLFIDQYRSSLPHVTRP